MSEFSRQTKVFMEIEVPKVFTKEVAAIEDYLYNFIISTSPVDTGAYRANHHRTADSPNFSFNPAKTSGKEPSPVGNDGFRKFYIANGAPYAQALEDGHSEQGKHIYANAFQSAKVKFGL